MGAQRHLAVLGRIAAAAIAALAIVALSLPLGTTAAKAAGPP